MSDDDKKIFKLVPKEKPPEEEPPGVKANDLLKEGIDNYDNLILVGWHKDQFKMVWSEDLEPEEVYVFLSLAKDKLLDKMYDFS